MDHRADGDALACDLSCDRGLAATEQMRRNPRLTASVQRDAHAARVERHDGEGGRRADIRVRQRRDDRAPGRFRDARLPRRSARRSTPFHHSANRVGRSRTIVVFPRRCVFYVPERICASRATGLC